MICQKLSILIDGGKEEKHDLQGKRMDVLSIYVILLSMLLFTSCLPCLFSYQESMLLEDQKKEIREPLTKSFECKICLR